MKRIEFHPDAAREANDAVDYYDERRAGLGEEFRADLRAALARIVENPELYAELSGVRQCPLSRFPYSVHYAELQDVI